MDWTIGKKIDPILERYHKKEIDLLTVRGELIILFNNELEQKLNTASVSGKTKEIIENCLFDFKHEEKLLSLCVSEIIAACTTEHLKKEW